MANFNNKMLAIYCRTSKSKKEGQDVSIPSQKKLGAEFAAKNGWDYRYFVDEGISGTKNDVEERPDFAEMLDLIRKDKISAVYCIDQSRIERNTNIWNLFVGIMLTNKCEFYPSGSFFDLDVAENIMYSGFTSLFNSFYATITSRKVKIADELNALAGKTHGLTAYGYQKDEKGYFKINEEEAIVVRRIFQLSLAGDGTYIIAKSLNMENIPTKYNRFDGEIRKKDKFTDQITIHNKKSVIWRGNVIYDMIVNPVYKGIRKWNEHEISIPAIIETELWDKTNKNLQENKKKVGRRVEYHYLLNGLIFCEDCGFEFRGKKRLKGGDIAYKCKGRNTSNNVCKNSRGINIPRIETFVIQHLFQSKELKEYLTSIPIDKDETNALKKQLESKSGLFIKFGKGIEKAYNLLLDSDFTDDIRIKDELKKLKISQKNLSEDIKIIEDKIIQQTTDARKQIVKRLIDDYSVDADFESIKHAVHSLVERITIKHTKNERSGSYLIKIKYRHFDEYSFFITDWQAMDWQWISRYRSQATNDVELQEDRDLAEYLIVSAGNKYVPDEGFKGSEGIESMHEIIKLKKEDLINFD